MRRLLEPGTSTRRTAAARQRLADHPLTRELLDAGLRLLLDHPGTARDSGGQVGDVALADLPSRFFDVLSAARVSAAATRRGPLRVTPAHLRDRWPRRGAFAEDLLAYGLSELHWASVRRAGDRAVTGGAPGLWAGPDAVAKDLAERNVHSGRSAALHRMQLLAAALAPGCPPLRDALAAARDRFEQASAQALPVVLARAGLEPRPGTDARELVPALALLTEGANLRLIADGGDERARSDALDVVGRGGLHLASAFFGPAAAPHDDDGSGPGLPGAPAAPGPPDLAEVLTRITDPASGTRRTEEGRRRLAQDDVTRQLLEGGIAVLAEEFGLTAPGRGSPGRAFDGLSAARVVAEARAAGGAGAQATVARLRDRWPVQEHYVDDLVLHALAQHRPAADALLEQAGPAAQRGAALDAAVGRATAARLAGLETRRDARLKVLVLVLGRSRHGVTDALAELYALEHRRLRALLEAQFAARGAGLREGVTLDDLTRWALALDDGALVRSLTTDPASEAHAGGGPLLARTVTALALACTVHPGEGEGGGEEG
ncbi:hypothetical protein FHN55_20915 [Streptomyces sp. NP160]|uniref:hypothetical protein n=1 Tax=Streptomyces sp. NP160 TaxID=2586637 RepID=UPI00111A6C17|nr:hypothetical protein [Streptomyces sp. NP160]TNM59491.1 hypothetical protein FHN55_20915 [Streptomyces sp. NP160]